VTKITVYGDVDQRAVDQLERCAEAGDACAACCAPTATSATPSRSAAPSPTRLHQPVGVGYDIACGNKAVRTNLLADDIARPAGLMDEIFERISFGVGRKNNEPVDHPVLDAIKTADFAPQRQLYDLAAKQLGTVGAGNHYVDLFAGDDGYVWVGVHFGSRGFGHKTATGFLALAEGKRSGARTEGEMDSPPILFHVDSDLGQAYIEAMTSPASTPTRAATPSSTRCSRSSAPSTYEVHNHHNFAWRERHDDTDVWVVRKGCTPAFPGQEGFVGATMGEPSVILEGVDSDASARPALQHRPRRRPRHVRTQAAGKSRKRWACNNRDCDWFAGPGEHKPEDGNCPTCGTHG
jgi:tRNA-splicing ligase RtcB